MSCDYGGRTSVVDREAWELVDRELAEGSREARQIIERRTEQQLMMSSYPPGKSYLQIAQALAYGTPVDYMDVASSENDGPVQIPEGYGNCDNTTISARSGDPDFTEHIHERQTGPKAQDSESYNARRGAGYSHVLESRDRTAWVPDAQLHAAEMYQEYTFYSFISKEG